MHLSTAQRASVALSVVIALLVTLMLVARAPQDVVRWLETPPILALFLAALATRPRTSTGWLTTVALGVSTLGDAVLVEFIAVPEGRLVGMGLFALAYVIITAAFWRGRPLLSEARVVVALGAVGVGLCLLLWPYLSSLMRVVLPAFIIVIATMAVTVTGTLARGWFPRRVSRLAAAAGLTLVASDSVVALQMFHSAMGVETTGRPAARYSGVLVGLMNSVASVSTKGMSATSQCARWAGKS